jgi:hypothetical protein
MEYNMPTEIKLIELEAEIEIILRSLRVGFKKTSTVKDV